MRPMRTCLTLALAILVVAIAFQPSHAQPGGQGAPQGPESVGDEQGEENSCGGPGPTFRPSTNVTFASDPSSRPAINFGILFETSNAASIEGKLQDIDRDLKYIMFNFIQRFSPQIIKLGFFEDCAFPACTEVLGVLPNEPEGIIVNLHTVLPWGVPLAVAERLAVDFGKAPDLGETDLPHRGEESMVDIYGPLLTGLVSAVQFTTPPADSSLPKTLVLRVASLEEVPPFMYKENGPDSNWIGFIPDLIDYWQAELPDWVSLEIVPIDAMHSGSFMDGIVGMVTDGLADIAVGPLFITSSRLKNVTFTHSWFDTGEVLITRSPEVSQFTAASFIGFLSPFSTDLWITVVISMLVAGLALWAVEAKSPTREGIESDFSGDGMDGFVHGGLDYSMWLSCSTFWGALATHMPISALGRLLSMTYALLILVVINSYTANLASYLTVTGNLDYPIQSLREAQTLGKKVCFLSGSRAEQLAQYEFPTLNTVSIDENTVASDNMHSAFEAAITTGFLDVRNKVCDGFVLDELFAQHYLRNGEWCDLVTVGMTYFTGNYAAALHPHMPTSLKHELTRAMSTLRADGTINVLLGEWFSHGDQCAAPSVTVTPFYVHDMAGIIVIFCIGLAVAMIAIAVRMIRKNRGGGEQVAPLMTAPDSSAVSSGAWMQQQPKGKQQQEDALPPARQMPPSGLQEKLGASNIGLLETSEISSGLTARVGDVHATTPLNLEEERSQSPLKAWGTMTELPSVL